MSPSSEQDEPLRERWRHGRYAELRERIKSSPAQFSEWSGWLEELPSRRFDLRHIELVGCDLTGASLAHMDLTGAVLDGATLDGVDLQFSVLDHASLRATRGTANNFGLAQARVTAFDRGRFDGADWSNLFFEAATARHVQLTRCRMVNAWGMRADLESATLVDCEISGVDFTEARLTGATLERCKVSYCDLRGALVQGAKLREVAFIWCRIDGVDFTASDLVAVTFEEPRPGEPVGPGPWRPPRIL